MTYNIKKIDNNILEKQIKDFIQDFYLKRPSTYNINYNFNINKTNTNPINEHIKKFCQLNSFDNKYKIKHNYFNYKKGKINEDYYEQIKDTYLKIILDIQKNRKEIINDLDENIKKFMKESITNEYLNSKLKSKYRENSNYNETDIFYQKYIEIEKKYTYHDEKLYYDIKNKIKKYINENEKVTNNKDNTSKENEESFSESSYSEENEDSFSGSSYSEENEDSFYESFSSEENKGGSYFSEEENEGDLIKGGSAKPVYIGLYRHFKIVEVNGKDYKNTSNADIKENQSPLSAASKLLGSYCRSEGIKKMDRPKMKPITFSIKETTRGSKNNIFGPYHGHYIKYTPAQMKEASAAGITFTMKPIVKRFKK